MRLAPKGFGRRLAVCFVAAPQRCSGIACVADASHPARRRSERGPCEFFHGLLSRARGGSPPSLCFRLRHSPSRRSALA